MGCGLCVWSGERDRSTRLGVALRVLGGLEKKSHVRRRSWHLWEVQGGGVCWVLY